MQMILTVWHDTVGVEPHTLAASVLRSQRNGSFQLSSGQMNDECVV